MVDKVFFVRNSEKKNNAHSSSSGNHYKNPGDLLSLSAAWGGDIKGKNG